MNAVFSVQSTELNSQFLNTIKTLFKGRQISIAISDDDETEYLLSAEANRKALENAMAAKDGYRFTPNEFKKISAELLAGKTPDFSKLKKVKLSV